MAKKQKVTLSLDPAIYAAFRQVADRIPGRVSLSALVEVQLVGLVQAIGPLLDQLESEPDKARQAALIRGQLGGVLLSTAGDLDARTRAMEARTEG